MGWQRYEADFLSSFRSVPSGSLAERLDLHVEAQISHFFELASIQDSLLFRACYLGRKIASLLIDEKGELQTDLLLQLNRQLEGGIFPLGPNREGDALIYAHVSKCLHALENDKEIWNWIRKFSPPLCHRKAEEVIRETLWPESIRSLQAVHIRRAAMAAWLTWLRQKSGSCFATAPAILIQKHPVQFFKDLYELLSIGQLKRVFSGKEYAVPMCPSIGSAELGRPIVFPDRLFFSPGLIAGLTAAQLLSPEEAMISKAEKLESALQGLAVIKTPEQVLRDLILKGVGLAEEDISDEEYLARIQMGPMIAREGAVFYQRPTLRAQKVADWKKRFKAAKIAFQALSECSLLRIWEYTIASFCDVKIDFAKWNLYVSLGMHTDHKGGIADYLYQRIDRKLQETNEEIQRLHRQYEQAVYAVRSLEALFHRGGEAQRYELQGQMSSAIHEAQFALNERDRQVRRAEAYAGLFAALMQHYDKKVQEFFQEVYDPSVSEYEEHLFEDGPAGFRLLYKHGRSDASTWELIDGEDTYIQSLRAFFTAVEGDIEVSPFLERGVISELTTELIQYIQGVEFLDAAKKRAQSIGRKTPWNYVSGGTMQSLVQAYYSRSEPLTEISCCPRNALDLLRFLSQEKKPGDLLMHSPTHAFVVRFDLFPENAERKAGENIAAAKCWKCGEEIQEYIGHSLSEKLPASDKALFLHLFRQRPIADTAIQLRQFLLETLQTVRGKSDVLGAVDSHLYGHMCLLSGDQIKDALSAILKPVWDQRIAQAVSRVEKVYMGAYELHQTAKSILLKALQTPFLTVDWDEKIASQIRCLGFSYPHLIQFADTNWSGWFFGFVANAFTGQTELWRLNRIGTQGYPMSDWQQWLSPGNKSPWILLPRAGEYSSLV